MFLSLIICYDFYCLVTENAKYSFYLCPRYFFTVRVTARDDGTEKLPKLNTASKMRSCIKNAIMDRYKVNITDKCLFPDAEKKWKAFSKEVVKNKRGDTEHHEEIDPET